MTGRRSARVAEKAAANSNAPVSQLPQRAGSKRKAESEASSGAKRGTKSSSKTQTTLEDSITRAEDGASGSSTSNGHAKQPSDQSPEDSKVDADQSMKESSDAQSNGDQDQKTENHGKEITNALDEIMKTDPSDPADGTPEGTGSKVDAGDAAVDVNEDREKAVPSNVLEKGVIYFFFRGRVGVEAPSDIKDIARSYIVLRPLPKGASLGDGPIGDSGSMRLLALPKKVLPVSGKDRFLTFVEKANVSIDDIKEQLSSSDYSTKTAGIRHTPSASPIGEGVYAITKTGRETHLAYIITLPDPLDDVQKDIGLRQRGSYTTSAKNPESAAPANASLPQGAKYPQEILDKFRGRGWMPLTPELLNYDNTQFLIIGHGDGSLEKATKEEKNGGNEVDQETPLEEIEKLEDEDEHRVKSLGEDNAVFVDLGLSSKEYSKVRTEW